MIKLKSFKQVTSVFRLLLLTGKVCPRGFAYRFGTCYKILHNNDVSANEVECKEATIGTGRAFVMPHVSFNARNVEVEG